jgi:nicotinate-nucleotide adenylyltransferase
MQIGILGGSFDPPHLGHYLIARQVLEFTKVKEVWLLPYYNTAAFDKVFEKQLSPAENRLEMARFFENKDIKVSNFEILYNKSSITIVTLEMLQKKYPEHTFSWITGSDKLIDFQKYDRWEDLVHNHNLIIFPREHMLWHLEDRVKEAFEVDVVPENVTILNNQDLALTNISSTLVRDRVRKGLSVRHFVMERVEEYIKSNKLYI